MKKFITLSLFLMFGGLAIAQQDAMFTKYMFNSLSYNPAYAGSRDYAYAGILYRNQWINKIDGAPETQTFTFHTPLKIDRVGVGISLINDKIGPSNTSNVNLAYAYRIPIGNAKLSIGLQGGMSYWRADWMELSLAEPDPAFDENPSKFLPNFGFGLFYYSKRFYAGVSSPHLIEHDLRDGTTAQNAVQYRHYYFSMGGAIPINGDALVFKPSLLIKNVGLLSGLSKDEAYQSIGAPTEFDIDLSLLFYEQFWVGTSLRSALEIEKSSLASFDVWVSYILSNGLRIGAAYDYPLSDLKEVTSGSVEVMIGYEFNYVTKKTVTPRYF